MAQISSFSMKPGDIFAFSGRRYVFVGFDGCRIRMIEPSEIKNMLAGKRSRGGGIRITRERSTPTLVETYGKHSEVEIAQLLNMIADKAEARQERVSEIFENYEVHNQETGKQTFTLANGEKVGLGDHVMVQFRNGRFECLIVGQGSTRPESRQLLDDRGRIGVLEVNYGANRSRPQYIGAEYVKSLVKCGELKDSELFSRVMGRQENVADKRNSTRQRHDMLREHFGF
jgi:hypothetical protein